MWCIVRIVDRQAAAARKAAAARDKKHAKALAAAQKASAAAEAKAGALAKRLAAAEKEAGSGGATLDAVRAKLEAEASIRRKLEDTLEARDAALAAAQARTTTIVVERSTNVPEQ